MNNPTTRTYPRTMQQAFGPYTSRSIDENYTPMHPHDKTVLWGCLLAAIALIIIELFA